MPGILDKIRQGLDSVFSGVGAARGDLEDAAWGRHQELSTVPAMDSGYVTVSVPAFYMEASRIGLDRGIPVIVGSAKVENTNTGMSSERALISTPTDGNDVDPEHYITGPVDLLFTAPFSASELNIEIALQFLPTQNLLKETLALITSITSKIPAAQASQPFLAIMDSALDTANQVLMLGQRYTRLRGKAEFDLGSGKAFPSIVLWIAKGRNVLAPTGAFEYKNGDLFQNDAPYKESSWIVFEFKYQDTYQALRDLPAYRQGLARLYDALTVAKASGSKADLKDALDGALILLEKDISDMNEIIDSDRIRIRDYLYAEADRLANKYRVTIKSPAQNAMPVAAPDDGLQQVAQVQQVNPPDGLPAAVVQGTMFDYLIPAGDGNAKIHVGRDMAFRLDALESKHDISAIFKEWMETQSLDQSMLDKDIADLSSRTG